MSYEKVLILDRGEVVAFATAKELLVDGNETFVSMLEEAGLLMFAKRKHGL